MKKRRLLLGVLCSLGAIVLIDVCLGRFALRDGVFLGRPVPPYGDVREARWQTWAKQRSDALRTRDSPQHAQVHDAVLGWTNAKNFRSPDGTQCFNSKGLRGSSEFDENPAPEKLRVALFGDSFVYGEEVPDGDDFAAQMSAQGPDFEVMNFGVGGFGTDQALMRFRSEGRDCNAQVMCIGVMLENIVRNVSRFTRLRNPYVKGLGIKPRYRLLHDALVLVPSPFPTELDVCDAVFAGTLADQVREHDAFAEAPYDNLIWNSAIARLYIGFKGSRARDYRRAWRDENSEAFNLMCAILQTFDAEARAAGARRAVVLVFPPKEDLDLVLGGGPRFWDGLQRELAQRNIGSIDFTDALAARAREINPARPSSGSVFLRAHLNRIGNEVVARALCEALSGI